MNVENRKNASAFPRTRPQWTFLTNHAVVFFHLADHPADTIRHISGQLGLAERTVAGILADLRDTGYVTARKQGRQNVYTINPQMPMRRPTHQAHAVDEFFSLLATQPARHDREQP